MPNPSAAIQGPKQPTATPEALSALLPDLGKLCRILRPRGDADDLAQEVALSVWRQMARGADIDALRPYLMSAARNRARRPMKMGDALEEADIPQVAPDAPARLATAEVLRAIRRLPRDHAVLLEDLARDGLSYRELAARHGLPMGTIMSRLARARAALRTEMQLTPDQSAVVLLEQ